MQYRRVISSLMKEYRYRARNYSDISVEPYSLKENEKNHLGTPTMSNLIPSRVTLEKSTSLYDDNYHQKYFHYYT